MPRVPAVVSLAVLFFAAAVRPIHAQKTEDGLIAAWEQAQKADPKTTAFEKMQDRQYHFATREFPFQGTLAVQNAAIEDFPGSGEDHNATGTVEVQLQGVHDEFYRTYAVSYAHWNQANTLYWIEKDQRWLTSKQYFERIRGSLPARAVLWPALLGFGWTGFLLVLAAALVFSLWRNSQRLKVINQRSERTVQLSERNSQIAERNLQIQEENARVFRDMLEELRKNSAKP